MVKSTEDFRHPIWGKWDVPETNSIVKTIGDLTFWIMQKEKELQIAYTNKPLLSNSKNTIPGDAVWQRWAFKTEKPVIEIMPVFPDRSVIVKPEAAFRVAEDASVRIFVRVPVWIKIVLVGKISTTLIELPTVSLSNTWFGTFAEGELCYWISSGARKKIEEDSERPYLAIAPLMLIDKSPEDLDVEKICLRVRHLSLYLKQDHLWADETKIIFKGMTEVSEIDFAGKPPAEAKDSLLISGPRVPMKKAFNARSFSTFKDLPGLGLFVK